MLEKKLEEYRLGAIGSILDEYERVLSELRSTLEKVDEKKYASVIEGESEHCCSIEVIMNHVVRAGYGYSNYIREALSLDFSSIEEKRIPQNEISAELERMFAYTTEVFENGRSITDEQMENVYFDTRWGVKYNIDQLMEHAIVHILRHRRQIEKFILILET